eukprot:10942940-Alexandrium_andersonii.AAC.1
MHEPPTPHSPPPHPPDRGQKPDVQVAAAGAAGPGRHWLLLRLGLRLPSALAVQGRRRLQGARHGELPQRLRTERRDQGRLP